MPYTDYISRDDAAALIPEEASKDIIQAVTEESVILKLGRRLANMARKQYRMPVLSLFPTAYFVDTAPEDKALKQTTDIEWDSVYINAEELAVIVPISDAVLEDVDYDIWAECKPQLVAAIGLAIDQAVLFGTNAPGTWPADILATAAAAGNTVVLGVGADVYADVWGVGGVISTIEADGYMHSGGVADITMRSRLRDLRDADGNLIYTRSAQDGTPYAVDGEPLLFPRNGSMDVTQAHMILGDWRQLVYSIRQDVTFKLFEEGIVQDAAGNIVYNLMQQDMVALRVTMRLGWQVPNPLNRLQANAVARYPFGALIP
ncbi:unnamed protein product [marine sediment metagenome]|uniref:Phage capsid-like C-terminal domain-containing protein n=1 Tax=marine sediment metagenome TaxID=412755 RepID=X0U253_9ZZZZ